MRIFLPLLLLALLGAPSFAGAEEGTAVPLWRTVSVIVLDLDGDKKFALRQADGDKGVYFDRDADGRAEFGDWLGAQDGILVTDLDGDGRISDGRELLIQPVGSTIEALMRADYNNDGRLDERDGVLWESLRVWRDLNQDGRSLPDEIYTLQSLGVKWIDISPTRGRVSLEVKGKRLVRPAGLVALRYDPARTIRISHEERAYLAEKLPDLPQLNKVPGLRALMAIDNDGSNSAFAMTARLAALPLEELFTRDSVALAEDILLRRAGVDQSARDYFGPLIDARRVAMPILLAGEEMPPSRPFGFWEAYEAERFYDRIRKELTARLWLQGEGALLFAGSDASYDPVRGNLRDVVVIDPAMLERLRVYSAQMPAGEREFYWRSIVGFINYVLGFENLNRSDYVMLQGVIGEIAQGFDLESLVREGVRLSPYNIAAAAQGERYISQSGEKGRTLRDLFVAVRKNSGDGPVVMTTVVTRHLRGCCKNMQEIMGVLKRSGFEVSDVSETLLAVDHPLRRFGYLRALRAVGTEEVSGEEGKKDHYELILYFNREGFEWAQAEMRRVK